MATNAATLIQAGSGTVLTVGAGMEFATLGDACAAAVAGDTIAVEAGTYVNDFATVNCALKIVSLGGLVNEVATVPPPNDKALLTVNANLSIQGFTFTGGSDGSPDGNVSGIRLQNGNLAVSYCYFHDMQEGLLAGADSTASISIDHSEFARNGSGDGYSHNLYVGAIASLTVTNSYFTASNVGHEIKSRAAMTTISNNVIADGPTGTGSYDIDIPNGGVATITNNVIEKGPLSSNVYAIHYSGETQFTYAKNALTVTGNTILNDAGPTGLAVLNQDYVNGLDVKANVSHNSFYGYAPGQLLSGNGTLSANTTLATEPGYSTANPYTAVPPLALAAGPQLLNLTNSGHGVTGGAVRLTVMDSAGSNTISGGAGGINVTDSQGWDTINTAAGASDAIILGGRNAVLHSAGNDHIAAPGFYEDVYATGQSTITGAGFNSYTLDGAGEKLTASGSGFINVGAAGVANITDMGGDYSLTVLAGGHAVISDQAAAATSGTSSVTVSGAATGAIANGGSVSLMLGDGAASVQAGAGVVAVACGAGADTLAAGAGTDDFTLGAGADRVVFGAGTASVTAGAGTDTYVFQSGQDGRDTITGYRPGHDVLSFKGFSGTAITAGVVVGDATVLTLSDGTSITFAGVTLPGYGPPATGVTAPAPAPPGAPAAPVSSGGTTVLTGGGNALIGGAALLSLRDIAGGNTITGGAGGLSLAAGDTDVVSTRAGSSSQITLGRWDTLSGAGSDQVTASGGGNQITEGGTAGVMLLGGGNAVQGGLGLLTVSDQVGGDTITGGTGGLAAGLATEYDSVTTAQGASDSISLAGKSSLLSQGTDQISLAGSYNQVTVTGAASITAAAGFDSYLLDGADSLGGAGGGEVTVGSAANVTIASAGSDDLGVCKLAGGAALVSESLPGGLSSLSVSGGAATISAAGGTYAGLSAVLGAGDTVAAGAGNITLSGGAGQDSFAGGSGQALITLGGDDTVSLGAGMLTVQGGMSDVFVVPQDAGGTLVIDNWSAQDSLVTPGQSSPDVLSQSVSGGSDWVDFAGGAQVELVGVAHCG